MSKIPISFPVQDFIELFLSPCCLFPSWRSYGEFGFCVRSESNSPEAKPTSWPHENLLFAQEKNPRRWPRAPQIWLCRQRPVSPLLQALRLMRRSHLRRRFRPRKTGHFRSCITRSRLERRTKIGSCASPCQQQRRSRRDLCNAQFVTRNLKNSWRDALFQRDEGLRRPSGNRLILRNGTVIIGGIALSAARSKLQRHEDAVRVVHVIAERFATSETASADTRAVSLLR